jgi:EmrB/QacA subfamily drug resistance transporter
MGLGEVIMKTKHKTFALVLFIMGVFITALDNGIISSALSTINYTFDVSEVQGIWGITLYTLGMAISTPVVGKLADRYGRRKLFLFEITLFAIGSLLVALSSSFLFFLVARLIQSFGGGGIYIIASSHILSTYDRKKQGKLLGALGAINGIASVVGPNLGALILKITGQWNWLFLINLPIAIVVIVAGWMVIPETKGTNLKGLDYQGLIFLTLGIFSFMAGITNLRSEQFLRSFTQIQVWGLFVLGVIFLTIFAKIEKHVNSDTDPFLPYQLIKNQRFLITILMGLLSGTLIAVFVLIPSFVEQRYGVPAATSGVWMSGIGLGSIIGAMLGGNLVAKKGATNALVISGSLSTVGFALVAYVSPNLIMFMLASTIAGIGFGMLMGAPFQVLMGEIASKKDSTVALGTLSVSRQVGLTLAPTLYATLIQGGFADLKLKSTGSSNIEGYYQHLLKMTTGNEQHELLHQFYQVAQGAYQQMFTMAVVASILILLGSWYLKKQHL